MVMEDEARVRSIKVRALIEKASSYKLIDTGNLSPFAQSDQKIFRFQISSSIKKHRIMISTIRCRGSYAELLVTKHLVSIQEWISVLIRIEVADNRVEILL
ncbi:hypothetical protein L6164_021233 [Bauhinia variegata]|uniref:Uncharacterized protein n=1 Tax=Bauhinia variegata TaxID=167791 RepID=A0ACB9MZ15_BAUVA|nr:hypothetical protein L6164_021233 [Bauhinia variegata]